MLRSTYTIFRSLTDYKIYETYWLLAYHLVLHNVTLPYVCVKYMEVIQLENHKWKIVVFNLHSRIQPGSQHAHVSSTVRVSGRSTEVSKHVVTWTVLSNANKIRPAHTDSPSSVFENKNVQSYNWKYIFKSCIYILYALEITVFLNKQAPAWYFKYNFK
jgi:hypothetical protein